MDLLLVVIFSTFLIISATIGMVLIVHENIGVNRTFCVLQFVLVVEISQLKILSIYYKAKRLTLKHLYFQVCQKQVTQFVKKLMSSWLHFGASTQCHPIVIMIQLLFTVTYRSIPLHGKLKDPNLLFLAI